MWWEVGFLDSPKCAVNSDDRKVISKEAKDWCLWFQTQETDITDFADEYGHGWN